MSEKSMWGDIGKIETIKTPRAILEEQANILGTNTKFLLRGDVEQKVSSWDSNKIITSLSIRTPRLAGYMQNIVTVEHTVKIYPLEIEDHVNGKTYNCNNEEEFIYTLQVILSSGKVREILSALLSYSSEST